MRSMGISGLTLYHLKSHLQKYRLGICQNPMARGGNNQDYKENETSRTIDENFEGGKEKPGRTLEICEALQIQMEVQKNLCQQVEVQKHLELRIEAQEKYMQSILQKAQETLAIDNSSSIGTETTTSELSKTVSMICSGSSLSLFSELEGSLPKNADTAQSGRNGCSLESSLTSSENSKRKDLDDQETFDTSNVDEYDGAQQPRNSRESKTFMFLESLDLN